MKLKDIIRQLRVFEQDDDNYQGHRMVYEVEYKDGTSERFNHREWNQIVANGKKFWEARFKDQARQAHEDSFY